MQYRRIMLKLLASCLFICLVYVPLAEARIRYHKWEVKYELKSPDCYKKLVITINGGSPGPTIFAQQGDTIIVEVTNKLFTDGVTIHWHGIRQVELYTHTHTLMYLFLYLFVYYDFFFFNV